MNELDDWALALDNATPISATGLLAYTVFADCTSTSVKPTLSLDESTIKAADQACIIDNNEVVPTKAGQCIVDADVSSSAVSASKVGKRASNAKVTMNYVFSSVGSFTRTSPTSTSVQTALPSTSTAKCSVTLSLTRRTATNAALLKCASLTKKSNETISIKLTGTSAKVCAVSSAGLVRRSKGTCKFTLRVMNKTKVVASRPLSIPVT